MTSDVEESNVMIVWEWAVVGGTGGWELTQEEGTAAPESQVRVNDEGNLDLKAIVSQPHLSGAQ